MFKLGELPSLPGRLAGRTLLLRGGTCTRLSLTGRPQNVAMVTHCMGPNQSVPFRCKKKHKLLSFGGWNSFIRTHSRPCPDLYNFYNSTRQIPSTFPIGRAMRAAPLGARILANLGMATRIARSPAERRHDTNHISCDAVNLTAVSSSVCKPWPNRLGLGFTTHILLIPCANSSEKVTVQ